MEEQKYAVSEPGYLQETMERMDPPAENEHTTKATKATKATAREEFIFSRPFVFEEREVKSIYMDLDSLTGRDVKRVIQSLPPEDQAAPVIELNKTFQAALAAYAADVPIELIEAASIKDYSAITLKVMDFLL